jgi:hypothetical protein
MSLRTVEQPAIAGLAPAGRVAQGLRARRFVTLADVEHAGTAQPGLRRDLVVGLARFAQSDDLHAPFVSCIARQRSHVGCFHHTNMMAHANTSS